MNYLVGAVFDRSQHEYVDAYQLSRRSYRSFLKGDWQELLVTGNYQKPMIPHGWAEMHKDVLRRIFALCWAGHNVLYAEVDTACVAPVEIFGKYPDMMMFWKTCAERAPFKSYMNSGVIYFPAVAQKSVWETLEKCLRSYDAEVWDEFQVVTNQMYWSQNPSPELVPELNWSPHVASPLMKEQAKILHFHASRGINSTVDAIREALRVHAG